MATTAETSAPAPAAPPERRRRGHGPATYDSIREAILDGRFSPGQRMVETRLAQELNVSRSIVREALKRLESDGLLTSGTNRRLVVTGLSQRDLEDIYALLFLLEGHAAKVAAAQITTGELDSLHEIQGRMQQAQADISGLSGEARIEVIRRITDLNTEFHGVIRNASRNSRLVAHLRLIAERPLTFQAFYWYSDHELAEASAEHADVLAALTARDGARAEQLMQLHVNRGLNTLLRDMPRM